MIRYQAAQASKDWKPATLIQVVFEIGGCPDRPCLNTRFPKDKKENNRQETKETARARAKERERGSEREEGRQSRSARAGER